MDQSVITEHDCNVLGGLFQIIVNDLKVCHQAAFLMHQLSAVFRTLTLLVSPGRRVNMGRLPAKGEQVSESIKVIIYL